MNPRHDTEEFQPLGKPVEKPQPTPKPDWAPVPGKPHLEQDSEGRYKYAPPTPKPTAKD
jgi:hypothetical protein